MTRGRQKMTSKRRWLRRAAIGRFIPKQVVVEFGTEFLDRLVKMGCVGDTIRHGFIRKPPPRGA